MTAAMGAAAAVVASRSADNPASRAAPLTIGKVARRSGFSVKALRFYEDAVIHMPKAPSSRPESERHEDAPG